MVATGSGVPPHVRFSLEQYLQMSEMGMFVDTRVEYIDGEIFQISPQMNDHAFVVSNCADVLAEVFPKARYWVRLQATLKIAGSAPEPDLAVTDGPRQPGQECCDSALLVVEVSDTTIDHDLKLKAGLYAAGKIADYWIIDVRSKAVIVHRVPTANRMGKFGSRYSQIDTFSQDQQVSPLAMPGAVIPVRRFFE
jgi:Uma2 family endonuclease